MGLIFIPNQAVQFVSFGEKDFNERNADCKLDTTEFCQIAHPDYPTVFQLKVTPDTGEELLSNGTFDTDLTGWTADPALTWQWDTLNGEPGAAGAVTSIASPVKLTQGSAIGATIGDIYRIVVDVCSFNTSTNPGSNFYIELLDSGGNSAGTVTGVGSSSDPITEEGTYTLFFESSVTDSVDFSMVLVSGVVSGFATAEIFICSASVMSVTVPQITLQDCDGNHVADIVDIVYASEYATVTVDWSNYDEGCYKICAFPEQDTGENLFGDLLCIQDELGNPILDENDNCIQAPI